jgi:RecB family endonuclease NucS
LPQHRRLNIKQNRIVHANSTLTATEKALANAQSELETAKSITEQTQKHAQDLKIINEGLLKLNKENREELIKK